MANTSIYAAFERLWQHVVAKLGDKANADHSHDDVYYTETEIDAKFSEVEDLKTLVGDTPVSEQINNAIADSSIIDKLPGYKTEGMTYTDADGNEQTCDNGEIFNDYRDVTFGENDDIAFPVTGLSAGNIASGEYSHAEGTLTIASGGVSHAEGSNTLASGAFSHAEGHSTTASGAYAHAEGFATIASGIGSIAEGQASQAIGPFSHAEGYETVTNGEHSHAEGYRTIASGEIQHVSGKYNVEDTENKYSHIVGNGTSEDNRFNAHTLDWDGNAWFQGDVYVGGTSQDDGVAVGEALATKIDSPTTAEVNQVLAVKTVDEDGKPTEWEAVTITADGAGIEVDATLSESGDAADAKVTGDRFTVIESQIPVVLTQDEYDALVASGEINENTIYLISEEW